MTVVFFLEAFTSNHPTSELQCASTLVQRNNLIPNWNSQASRPL